MGEDVLREQWRRGEEGSVESDTWPREQRKTNEDACLKHSRYTQEPNGLGKNFRYMYIYLMFDAVLEGYLLATELARNGL